MQEQHFSKTDKPTILLVPFKAQHGDYYAVIDTNLFLSALPYKNEKSASVKVLDAVFKGKMFPLYRSVYFSGI